MFLACQAGLDISLANGLCNGLFLQLLGEIVSLAVFALAYILPENR